MKIQQIIITIFLSSFLINAKATTFAEMFKGFLKCSHTDVYVDVFTHEPVTPYFMERNLKPYKVQNELAFYKVNETLFGLPVDEISIPTGTYAVHELYIDMPISNARKILKHNIRNELRKSISSDNGLQPELFQDKNDSKRSVLSCQDTVSGI